ncbi:MAG: MucB/RseB C-terminal domain-containing protein, partial [Pseudomonadota bacterium]
DGYEREHVVTLTGVPHQVVRDNFTMTRFLPEKKAVTVKERRYRRGGPLLMSFDPAVLGEVYAFRFLGKGRIAGRVADVVGIQPNDQLRYGYRLYLDEEFGLPLKTDILDAKGKAISQLMFTDISVTPEAAASIQASEAKVDALRPPAPKTYSGDWQFTDLPPGFTMAAHRRWEGNSSQAGEHLLFTDGMASVSVYVEEGAAADHKEGASRMGAVMALGVPRDGHLITVVGEVPLSTLRLVLKSMSRKSDE